MAANPITTPERQKRGRPKEKPRQSQAVRKAARSSLLPSSGPVEQPAGQTPQGREEPCNAVQIVKPRSFLVCYFQRPPPWHQARLRVLPYDRAGFGDVIQFTTGTAAEALLPVERRALPDRPGFGYTINFLAGDPADSLYPLSWAKQRRMTLVSQD